MKLLEVMRALWKVAQNGLQQSSYSGKNRLNSKLPEHQMRKCRAVRLAKYERKISPKISGLWAIYLISSAGTRKCCLELCRACKNNHLLLSSYFLGSHNCGRVPGMLLRNAVIHFWTYHPGIYLIPRTC